MTEQHSSLDENQDSTIDIPVEKDSTFARHVSDHVLVFYMGRDVELSFLQTSPKVVAERRLPDDSKAISFKLSPSHAEVARIRISPAAATQLAMTILGDLVEGDEIDPKGLHDAIQRVIDRAQKSSQSDQEELPE